MSTFQTQVEAIAAVWHGVTAPNDPARRFAEEMRDTIAAFEKLRGTLVFEDEPSSFEAALQATKESGQAAEEAGARETEA
jgi:hypothetical protein